MTIRVLADDGSIHQFPDGTRGDVIGPTLARYHAGLLANDSPPQPAPYWPPLRDMGPRTTNNSRPGGPPIPMHNWVAGPDGGYQYRVGSGPWTDAPEKGMAFPDTVNENGKPGTYSFRKPFPCC